LQEKLSLVLEKIEGKKAWAFVEKDIAKSPEGDVAICKALSGNQADYFAPLVMTGQKVFQQAPWHGWALGFFKMTYLT
jgi:hypothetical protein